SLGRQCSSWSSKPRKTPLNQARQALGTNQPIEAFYQKTPPSCIFRLPWLEPCHMTAGFADVKTVKLVHMGAKGSSLARKARISARLGTRKAFRQGRRSLWRNPADVIGRRETAGRYIRRPAGEPWFPVSGVHGRR